LWAHPRHTDRLASLGLRQPLSGWFGHAAPFEFAAAYRAAPGIKQFACGTPPVLSMAALECGIDVFQQAEARGGMAAVRSKSIVLTNLFIELVEARVGEGVLALASPREALRRGSQVSFSSPHGHAVMQALIARGVIGDFRAGDPSAPDGSEHRADLLRFGFTPLYTRYADVWAAATHLHEVLDTGEWREGRFQRRDAVT
jgi:kynureninase